MEKKKVAQKPTKEVRVAGTLFHDGVEEMTLEPVRSANGFGRWIYCKYCYKNVRPMLSGINQIVCSECSCGLTPDFFSMKNLKRWLNNDESALDDDRKSKEAKKWLAKAKLGFHRSWTLRKRSSYQ